MGRRKWLILRWMLAAVVAAAQLAAGAAWAATDTAGGLAGRIDALLYALKQDANSSGIRAGIAVYDADADEWPYRHDAGLAFVPASNLKILVSAAALDRLGPEYQFATEVYATGEVNGGGVLQGDLVLKGHGDPSLTPEDFTELAARLKEKGIRRVAGNLLLDESEFDDVRLGPGWMWDDEPYGYSAQVSALAVNKNAVTVTIRPDGPPGGAATLTAEPENGTLRLENRVVVTDGTAAKIQVERPRGQNTATVSGEIGKAAAPDEEEISVEDPALFVADVFARRLQAAGIQLDPKTQLRKTVLKGGQPLAVHYSRPLVELVTELNKESDNFYAEMLLKALGATRRGEGSFAAGAAEVAAFLERAGVSGGYRQVDGSGLSRLDLVTPEQLVRLLTYVRQQEYGPAFEASLPIAGVDGTLASRMKGTPAEGNLHAKTGSMSGVYCLSGYVTAKNGHHLVFSVLLNGVYKSKPARDFQDQLGALLASYPEMQTAPAPSAPAADAGDEALAKQLDAVLADARLSEAAAGIAVVSLDRANGGSGSAPGGTVLYRHNADSLFTPAASVSLLTGIAAWKELGGSYRFRTEVYAGGKLTPSGVLHGDLILKGYGDPTLTSAGAGGVFGTAGRSLAEMARTLRANGLKQLAGNIVVDDSWFDDQRLGLGWPWDQESDPSQAQISALAVDQGTVTVHVAPGRKPGDPVQLSTTAPADAVVLNNQAVTADRGERPTFSLVRQRAQNVLVAQGALPEGTPPFDVRVTVEDPALIAGALFKQQLAAAGISVAPGTRVVRGPVPSGAAKLASWVSPPLSDILRDALRTSQPFAMEMLLKALGKEKRGTGSAEAGVEAEKAALAAMGVDTTFDQMDGSGVTRYNQLSPVQAAAALAQAARDDNWFSLAYVALPSVPASGSPARVSGSGGNAPGVHAVVGVVPGVASMSGYAVTPEGERLAFSVMINGFADEQAMREVLEHLASVLAAYRSPAALADERALLAPALAAGAR